MTRWTRALPPYAPTPTGPVTPRKTCKKTAIGGVLRLAAVLAHAARMSVRQARQLFAAGALTGLDMLEEDEARAAAKGGGG